MLHVAETWAMTAATLSRLPRNDRAMFRWICNVKARDEVSSETPSPKAWHPDPGCGRSIMRWFGHVQRSTG